MLTPHADSAQVAVPPPLVVLATVALAFIFRLAYPAEFLPDIARFTIGGIILFDGLVLMFWSATLFRKHETDIKPWMPTLRIIKEGPYKYSRNPIYLSFFLISTGGIVLANNAVAFLLLIPLYFYLRYYVIAREEDYLTRKFGQEYLSYTQEIRRWL